MIKFPDNLKTVLTIVIFLSIFSGAVAWAVFRVNKIDSTLPDSLKLKVEKSKIINSEEVEAGVIKYDYISAAEVLPDNLEKTKDQLVLEFKKSTTTAEMVEVYDQPKEDISKRTKNIKQYKIGLTKDDKEVWVAKVYGGSPFYKEGDKWFQTETATTTKQAFNTQMRPTLADRVKMFFGQKVYAVTVYGNTTDGHLTTLNMGYTTWAQTHDATTASNYNQANSASCIGSTSSIILRRSFFDYSLVGISGTVGSVTENIYGYSFSNGDASTQKGSQSLPPAGGDFQAFSGVYYATLPSWSTVGYNSFQYNATGIADVQTALGGTLKTCVRDYSYDYLDVDPGALNKAKGAYFTDYTGTTNDPYLEITFFVPKTFKIEGQFKFKGKFDFATSTPPPPPWQCGIESVADVDGNLYSTLLIGDQCWMSENLMTTKYADGTSITRGPVGVTWDGADHAYYAYPPNVGNTAEESLANIQSGKLGFVYQWSAAMHGAASDSEAPGPQGACPTGWHLPTDTEWMTLEEFLGMCSGTDAGCSGATGFRGTDQGSKLSNETLNGNNSSGFTAHLAGCRYSNGSFNFRESSTPFWSSAEFSASYAWIRYLASSLATVSRYYDGKERGFSVRCVKD